MAVCNIIDDADRSAEEYDRITAHVRGSGPVPPEGCRLVLLGRERAITVWDSREDRTASWLSGWPRPIGPWAARWTRSPARRSTLRCSSRATLRA